MNATPTGRPLTKAQAITLGVAGAAMIGVGALGACGTYGNLTTVFPGSTALGAVAAGEGATLILALVYVGLTMLGQSAPSAVRLGLWALPAVAAAVGAVAAHGVTATVVYAVTPMAMCTAAEGAGLLARRIVVRVSGVDLEARRRGAAAVRRLAVQRARAQSHPDGAVRWIAERRAWHLAARIGVGDVALDDQLLHVQRERLAEGADAALAAMFATSETPAGTLGTAGTLTRPDTVPAALETAPEPPAEPSDGTDAGTPGTPAVTQANTAEPDTGTPTGTPAGTPVPAGVTLTDLAAVADVPAPVPGVALDDDQLAVVLRWLRHHDDPPMSYRQAKTAFRAEGFIGSEERVRRTWGALLVAEDDEPPTD
ncbi:hypothetical protein V2S66_32940 [Streptomyces sp. V4-01]|uniref:DUF2637 domain-containing protein n=1 Tax=Actinacidiphila polyblastidii TaxID=3110430 RepID=A0ABU7PLQ1_9ACTN|nr:hypothetical protein [Streptomyces sp. V4-01]